MSLNYKGKWHLPLPTGKYVVGFTDIMTDDCFVRLFYPTGLQDIYEHHEKWATWIPHPKYNEGYATVQGIFPSILKHVIPWVLGYAYVPIVEDALPAVGKFPTVVFSHGLSACRTAYSVFCSDIASHGFIVAVLEHRDTSACMSLTVKLQDDRKTEEWVPYKPMKLEKDDFELRQSQLEVRIQDCQRALTLLQQLNKNPSEVKPILSSMDLSTFQDRMDLTNPALAGHSFGGATLLRTLAVDKRFKLGIALDPWLWPLRERIQLHEQVEQPLLVINMEDIQTRTTLKYLEKLLENPNGTERRVFTLRGSVHRNQCDLPLIIPSYLKTLSKASSRIDPEFALTLNNRISLLFLWKHNNISAGKEHEDFVESQQSWYYEGINYIDKN